MNIKQAKEQINNAVKSYFTKDENGEYIIPIEYILLSSSNSNVLGKLQYSL